MDFATLLDSLRNPGDDGPNETIYDDITAAYSAVSERADSGDARIAEMTAANDALKAEIAALKARNYDLLMAVDAGSNDSVSDSGDDSADEDDDDFIGVDDLFNFTKD